MRSNRTHPIILFSNAGQHVYSSDDQGDNWVKLNNTPFPADVSNIGVTKFVSPSAVVYAALNSTTTGQRLRVYDGGTFFERSTGLPSGEKIRSVSPHITNTSTAYALINGFSGVGEKVYKTTNRGVSWSNISSNLPDVPMGDLIPHPSNSSRLYLGTQFGCYRTTNTGASWHRWNNGMPEATIITELKWIDSTLDNGKFYIVAGSYGRSLWTREISGDDPENSMNLTVNIQGFYRSLTNTQVVDTMRVYLRNDDSPYAIIDSAKVVLNSSGNASIEFPNVFNGELFYIQLKHRNSIETWSAQPVSFEDYYVNYDFTNAIGKAYGSNMIFVDNSPIEYAIYNGDVDQDGVIDGTDTQLIDNHSFNFLTGYLPTDVNGDSFIDGSDAAIADNNASNFVSSVTP